MRKAGEITVKFCKCCNRETVRTPGCIVCRGVKAHHKRAIAYQVQNTLTQADAWRRYSAQDGKCFYCSKALPDNGAFVIDHVLSMSYGGRNAYENIAIVCDGCNTLKGAMHPDRFARANGYDIEIYREVVTIDYRKPQMHRPYWVTPPDED